MNVLSTTRIGLSLALACTLLTAPLPAGATANDELSPSEHRELRQLTDANGGTIQIRWDEERGTPRFISGKLSKPLKGKPVEQALAFLGTVKHLYHVDKPKHSFKLLRVDRDEHGMQHVRFTHIANNIPVWGDEVIVHIDKGGVVRSVNGQFTPKIELNSEKIGQPKLSAEQAIQAALNDLKVAKPDRAPTATLHYFAYPTPDMITLVYVVNVLNQQEPADWKVFVDAVGGDVVHKYNDLKFKKQQ